MSSPKTFLRLFIAVCVLAIPLASRAGTVTTLADSGPGSLRDAIANAGPGETIDFAVTGTILLTSDELKITTDLFISGPGPTNVSIVSSNHRIFNIQGSTVFISGLTLSGSVRGVDGADAINFGQPGLPGLAPAPQDTMGNGGGGAICFAGNLNVTNCVFENCVARGGNGGAGFSGVSSAAAGGKGGPAAGGAIFRLGGQMVLYGCTFVSNSATGGTGGSGGTANSGSATVGGTGGVGGDASGGAVATGYSGGQLTMENCTFGDSNFAQGGGGGQGGNGFLGAAGGQGGRGGNSSGGGIFISPSGSCGVEDCPHALDSCTVSGNHVLPGMGGPGGTNIFSGGMVASPGINGIASGGGLAGDPIAVVNSIIAGNNFIGAVGVAPDVAVDMTGHTLGHNLIGKTDGSSGWIALDLTGTILDPLDPLLFPLQDNGGPTPTMALPPCSPAMDNGIASLDVDQRGLPRPVGVAADIGAYEIQDTNAVCLTVTAPCHGVVVKNPDLPGYPLNSVVTLRAIPEAGWAFAGWAGDASGSVNPLQVTVTNGKSITAAFTPLASPCACPLAGLVDWWPAGNNANDIAGSSNGVLVNGATFTTGEAGLAFSFNGVNQYVQVPGFLNNAPDTEVTVEFWQFVAAKKVQSTFSASAFVSGSVFNAHVPYSDGNVYWDFGNISAGGRLSYTPPVSIVGSWQHFALVASQSGAYSPYGEGVAYMAIYRNGALEAQQNTMTPLVRANLDLDIGGAASLGISFGGQIDEFSIYNRALSPAEILDLYNAGGAGKCLPPVYILNAGRSGNNVTLTWLAQAGLTYRVQFTTQPGSGMWTDVAGDVIASGSTASKTDVLPPGTQRRFYRIILYR